MRRGEPSSSLERTSGGAAWGNWTLAVAFLGHTRPAKN